MNDTLVTIIAIFIAAILMFVFPLMTIADRNDDVAQQAVQQKTVEFVDKERNVGSITQSDLSDYKEQIASLGHTFNVDMEVKKMDDSVVGENVYYSVYTDTIESQVYGSSGKYTLKEGDIFSATATNTDVTIAQSLRNAFYAIAGKGTYQISGSHSGVVQNNGTH